jgi:hypothetical protein
MLRIEFAIRAKCFPSLLKFQHDLYKGIFLLQVLSWNLLLLFSFSVSHWHRNCGENKHFTKQMVRLM